MIFSKNTHVVKREEISALWTNETVQQYEKYLGLPLMIGRSKRMAFFDIKQKVWQTFQVWKEKLLSQQGKEVLLKAVALAIPTYAMSCFKFPNNLCSELKSLMASFWWGQRGDERTIHWLKWEKLCVSKFQGGMGFKDLRPFNPAFIAKQGWRMLYNTDNLLHIVYKARYFPLGNFFEARLGHNLSYARHGIWEARNIMLVVYKQ